MRTSFSVPDTSLSLPVTILEGSAPGPTVVVSAGVHSREYIGIEAVKRLAQRLSPALLAGKLLLFHCINYEGFLARTADVFPHDGKNLNRAFPGRKDGTVTERLAWFLEKEIYPQADYLLDLHSGGFCEALTPHAYFHAACAPEVNEQSRQLASWLDVGYIVASMAKNGFYSRAGQCGIPAIILERGGCGLWSEAEVEADVADVENILRGLRVLRDGKSSRPTCPELLTHGYYLDAPASGCWYPAVRPGDRVKEDQLLGFICTLYGETLCELRAREAAIILYETVSLGIEKDSPPDCLCCTAPQGGDR